MNIVFYDNETKEDVFSLHVDGFPSIHAGDIVSLRTWITPIGRQSWPSAKESRQQLYKVVETRHVLEKMIGQDISNFYHLEICVSAFPCPPHPTPPSRRMGVQPPLNP